MKIDARLRRRMRRRRRSSGETESNRADGFVCDRNYSDEYLPSTDSARLLARRSAPVFYISPEAPGRPSVGRQAALPLGAEEAAAAAGGGGGDGGQRMTREVRRGNLIKMRPVVYLSKSYIPLSRRPTVRRMGRDHRQKQVDQPITPTHPPTHPPPAP